MKVLSLFDGMSCGQIALERAGRKIEKYYASEIDKYAKQITMENYPNTIQLGDVTKWREWNIETPDLIMGGSPCQGFSFAGKQLNFDDPRSKLFFEFVAILKHYKPKYFLLENVKMKKEHQNIISEYLGVESIEINSALLSAQNRKRLYWTNIPNVTQPEDKGILLKDILNLEHNGTLTDDYIKHKLHQKRWGNHFGTILTKKSNTLCAIGKSDVILLTDKKRYLDIIECERLQTVPDNYTEGVSNTQRYKMLGNGWTVDVIAHILSNIK